MNTTQEQERATREKASTPALAAVDRAGDAATPDEIDAQTAGSALDWFLDPDPQEIAKGKITVNVATVGQKKHEVEMTLQVLDRDRIREIRKECEVIKGDGEREINEMEANLRIATEGLIDPNPRDIVAQKQKIRGQVFLDPADVVRTRFLHKPGAIDNIATRVLELSGYNDKDVGEIRAAGN